MHNLLFLGLFLIISIILSSAINFNYNLYLNVFAQESEVSIAPGAGDPNNIETLFHPKSVYHQEVQFHGQTVIQ